MRVLNLIEAKQKKVSQIRDQIYDLRFELSKCEKSLMQKEDAKKLKKFAGVIVGIWVVLHLIALCVAFMPDIMDPQESIFDRVVLAAIPVVIVIVLVIVLAVIHKKSKAREIAERAKLLEENNRITKALGELFKQLDAAQAECNKLYQSYCVQRELRYLGCVQYVKRLLYSNANLSLFRAIEAYNTMEHRSEMQRMEQNKISSIERMRASNEKMQSQILEEQRSFHQYVREINYARGY